MLAALFLGFRRIWVWGWLYAEAIKEKEEWKSIALAGLRTAADVAQAAQNHVVLTAEESEKTRRIIREAGNRE